MQIAAWLLALALVHISIGVYLAIHLNRRMLARFPERRPFAWGYFNAIFGMLISLELILSPFMDIYDTLQERLSVLAYGAFTFVFSFLLYRRNRWVWLAAVILNPVTLAINGIYLKNRWREMKNGSNKRSLPNPPGPTESSSSTENRSVNRYTNERHDDGDALILNKRADINKRAELVLEYSDEAIKNLDRLKQLPNAFAQTFIEKLEEDPSQDTKRLADSLIEAHEAEIRPYENEDQNQALNQARELGPDAEQEFRKVLALLGDKVDANEVLVRLRKKFLGPFEQYRGYAVLSTPRGTFEIRNANHNKVPTTLEYDTKAEAKHAIDYLNRRRKE